MPEKGSASSAPVSTLRQSPRRAAWSPRYSTTGRLQSRRSPPVLSRPSSIQLGVLVNRIEAYLDSNRGKVQDGAALDNLIHPFCSGPCIKIDTALVLLNYRILPDRRRSEVIKLLAASILPLGAR